MKKNATSSIENFTCMHVVIIQLKLFACRQDIPSNATELTDLQIKNAGIEIGKIEKKKFLRY
jgi:hypothetical protein